MYNLGFNFARQQQAADGYLLLFTNPRGSTGYCSSFGNASNHLRLTTIGCG